MQADHASRPVVAAAKRSRVLRPVGPRTSSSHFLFPFAVPHRIVVSRAPWLALAPSRACPRGGAGGGRGSFRPRVRPLFGWTSLALRSCRLRLAAPAAPRFRCGAAPPRAAELGEVGAEPLLSPTPGPAGLHQTERRNGECIEPSSNRITASMHATAAQSRRLRHRSAGAPLAQRLALGRAAPRDGRGRGRAAEGERRGVAQIVLCVKISK